ncbi:MAG: hypothetical protein HS116_11440 [Planctomycetes bacterium]|nr:hypothetical protein [Planctomycetota bacterium]
MSTPDSSSEPERTALSDGWITFFFFVLMACACALTWYWTQQATLPGAPGAPVG